MLRERCGIPLRPARQQRRADADRRAPGARGRVPALPTRYPRAAICGSTAHGSRRSPDGRRARLVARSPRNRTPQRRYALLCIVAALLVTPALAYADLLTATITNQQQNVLEGTSAIFTVTLSGGTPTQDVVVQFKVSGTAEPETAGDDLNGGLRSTDGGTECCTQRSL